MSLNVENWSFTERIMYEGSYLVVLLYY